MLIIVVHLIRKLKAMSADYDASGGDVRFTADIPMKTNFRRAAEERTDMRIHAAPKESDNPAVCR